MSYQTLERDENDVAEGPDALEFKSFLGSEQVTAHGNSARTSSPPPGANSRGYLVSEQTSSSFWTIEYYQKYFDVDTKTVLLRCYRTMIPQEDYVGVVLESRPDMYGPFWTCTTVIFSLFVFSSLASSITSYLSDKPWDYDFKKLSVAVGVVYSYGLGVPIALWAALKYHGVNEWGVLDAVDVWGYGMTVWIPVSLICIAPVFLLRVAVVGLACCLSGYFLVRNVYPILVMAEAKAMRLLVVAIAVLHLAVALTFKFAFFNYYIIAELGTGPKDPAGTNGTRITF